MKIEYTPKSVKYKLNIEWKMATAIILLLIIIVINTVVFFISNNFYNSNFNVSLSKGKNQHDLYINTFSSDRYNSLEKENVYIYSKYGFKIYGTFIKNPKPSKNTIILVNGANGSRWSMMEYLDMYLNKGFNVLSYDSRDCGESGGNNLGYGYFEKYDLDKWVDWVVYASKKISTLTPSQTIIGIHGVSTGAATAILQTELNANNYRVRFYIADSSFSDLNLFLKNRLETELNTKNKYIINYLMFFVDAITMYRSGLNIQDVSPINVVKDISTPILFINGKKDNITPVSMTEDLYKVKLGKKSIYITDNAGDGKSYKTNPQAYTDTVYKFIDSVTATVK